jgi:hypothetical protein
MAENGVPIGDDVLEAVTEAMVALHERYHGRGRTRRGRG